MASLLHLLLHCAATLLIANALVLTGDEAKTKGGFPIPLSDDVDGVELPLEVEQEVIPGGGSGLQHPAMPPAWLFEPEPPAPPPPKHRTGGHKTIVKHPTASGFHKLSAHGHRSCHVEIVSQVQGICQSMPMGSACVTDDYMVVYTDANCSAQ